MVGGQAKADTGNFIDVTGEQVYTAKGLQGSGGGGFQSRSIPETIDSAAFLGHQSMKGDYVICGNPNHSAILL